MNSTSVLNSVKSQFEHEFETSMKARIADKQPQFVQKKRAVKESKSKKRVEVESDEEEEVKSTQLPEASILPTTPIDPESVGAAWGTWWIAHLQNGEIVRTESTDILLGFYATSDSDFTFNYGYTHEKHRLEKDTFVYAYNSDVLPLVGYEVQKASISDLSGSGYAVFAKLTRKGQAAFRNH